jgi:hypothetical protein
MSALHHGARHEHAARREFGDDGLPRKPASIARLRETVQAMLRSASTDVADASPQEQVSFRVLGARAATAPWGCEQEVISK